MQDSTVTVSQNQRVSFFRERRPSNSIIYTNPSPAEHPAHFKHAERAMTAPTLSVSTPPTQSFENPRPKPKKSKSVFVVEPTKEEKLSVVGADPYDSDVSSICRSPAWDGGDRKQKRQAKKEAQDLRKNEEDRLKRQKEKAEKEIRAAAQKQKGRLSKAPPADRRQSKAIPAIPISRADSEPSVHFAPRTTQPSPDLDDGRRSRRTSLDLGIKKLMSSFRSRSSSASASGTPRNQFASTSPTSSGFIGGLKLQQSNETSEQTENRDGKPSNNKPSQSRPPISLDNSRYRALDLLGSSGAVVSAAELPTKPQSEGSPGSHILPQPEAKKQPSSDAEPIMNRNIRARKPSDSVELNHIAVPMVNAKAQPQAQTPSSPGFRFGLGKTQPSAAQEIQEPLYFQNFDTSPEAINPESSEYISKQKRRDKEGNLRSSSHNIELEPATKNETMRRTLSIHDGLGRVKTAHGVGENASQDNSVIAGNGEDVLSFLQSGHASPDLKLTSQSSQSSIQPEEGLFSRRDLRVPPFSPSHLSPRINHTNDTATTYSTQVDTANSPTLQTSHLDAPLKKIRLPSVLSPHASGIDSRSALPSQSSRRVSESEYSSSTIFPRSDINPAAKKKLAPPTVKTTSTQQHKTDQGHSSTSFTGSSEEYLSFDEQSNITTPAVSRPQSQQGPTASIHDTVTRQYQSVQDDWNQTPLRLKLKDKVSNISISTLQTTPETKSASPYASLASADPNTAAGVADLQRRLSLSKSSSTTALNNPLNFLPELKHQPLRARQGQGKRQTIEGNNVNKNGNGTVNVGTKKGESTPGHAQYNYHKNPINASVNRLNGGASSNSNYHSSSSEKDNNNESSQYLRSARLAIPPKKTIRSSSASPNAAASSAQSLLSNGQGGIEPMAKMFVICCGCKYFHDMPSKLYECMAKPEVLLKDEGLGVSGVVSTRVSCPWCGHGMSTRCCEGWASVVVMKERMH